MTDLRKAAKDALLILDNIRVYEMRLDLIEKHPEVKEALRQALAQPETDCYGYASRLATYIWEKHYKEDSPEWKPFNNLEGVLTQIDNMVCGLVKAQPEQEPAAWIHTRCGHPLYLSFQYHAEDVPLYTAPPKREWVGLTDEESIKLLQKAAKHKSPDYCTAPEMAVEFGRLASESLKEKNT